MTLSRRRGENKRGAAAVELAVLLPFLMFLGVIATDWARILYFTMSIGSCARSGAFWASDADIRGASPYTTVGDAAKSEAPTLSGLTVTQTNLTDGGDGMPAIQVKVEMTFTTIAPFKYPKWFGITHSGTISRTVQMRVGPTTPN